jgi:hypothetical protein
MRGAEFTGRHPSSFGQPAERSIAALCAFEYPARDMPSGIMLLASDRENLAGPLQGHFHVRQGSRVKAFRNSHGRLPSTVGLRAMFSILRSRFRGPPPFCEKHSLQVRGISENAGPLHSFGSLRTGLHVARSFQGAQRFRIEVDFRSLVFLLSIHGNQRWLLIHDLLFFSQECCCYRGTRPSPAALPVPRNSVGSLATVAVSA